MGSTALSGSNLHHGRRKHFAYAMAGDIIAGTSNGGTGPGSSGQTSDYNLPTPVPRPTRFSAAFPPRQAAMSP